MKRSCTNIAGGKHLGVQQKMAKYKAGCEDELDSDVLGGKFTKLNPSPMIKIEECRGTRRQNVGCVNAVISTVGGQTKYTCGREDMSGCAEEDEDIKMPPWSISLVGMVGESSMESINIPHDVHSDYVDISPAIKFVSAACVSQLLKQIAGLTSIAMQRSEEARELIFKHQLHTDAILSHRIAELIALRRQMVEYHDGARRSYLDSPTALPDQYGIATSRTTFGKRDWKENNAFVMLGCRSEQNVNRVVEEKMDLPTDCLSMSTSDDKMCHLDGEVETTNSTMDSKKLCKEIDPPRKVRKLRRQISVSDHPADIIYCSWKITKSE